MAKDKDLKHVIVLDDGKRPRPDEEDEAQELLEELDRYAPEEDDDDGEIREERKPVRAVERPARVKRAVKLTKKGKLIIFLLVSVFILTLTVLAALYNSDLGYREPVAIYEKYLNRTGYDGEELSYAYANGLAKHQFRELRDIQNKSDEYVRSLEESKIVYNAEYLDNIAKYGENFKCTVTIDRAEALSEGRLRELTDDFYGLILDLSSSSMARADDKELAGAVGRLTDKLSDAHITRGYHLYCTKNYSGQLDDGPVSSMEKCDFTVVKLNGHWIMWEKIYDVFRMTF